MLIYVSHCLSVFIICEANDSRSESSKGLFTDIQCITIVSLCPLNNPREGIFSPTTSLSFFFTLSLPPWRFQCMTLICTMQVKRNSPTSYGQARNILGDTNIFQGKERRKDKGHAWTHCWVTAAPPCPDWEDSHAVNEWLIKLPLYI